jgi:hypothetical protein
MKERLGRTVFDVIVAAAVLAVAPPAAGQNNPPETNLLSVVVIEASDNSAAETGLDAGTFTVRRSAPTNLTLHVTYQTGGTASPGSDYQSLSGYVTIPAGAWTATITVTPIDDHLAEGPETVIVRLSQSPLAGLESSYRIGSPSNSVVTIADNDVPAETNRPPVVRIVSPQGGAVFTAPANITLIAQASDPDGQVSTVEFFEGTNSIALTTNLPVLNPIGPFVFSWPKVPAGEYTLTAKATDYQGAMSVSDPVHIRVYGANTQPVVNIFTTDEQGTEIPVVPPGQGRPQLFDPAVFTVTRTGGTNEPLEVFYSVSGTASNGVDYEHLPGRVTIPAGASSAEIQVAVIDDFLVEGTETVILTLEPPICIAIFPPPPGCYLVGASSRASAFIRDDDVVLEPLPVVTIVATDPEAAETGPDPGTFTVTRTGSTSNTLIVLYFTGGTAQNGADYHTLSNFVVIPAGSASAEITVAPIDDGMVEPPETVVVQLRPLFFGLDANGGVLPGEPIPSIILPTLYVVGFPSNAVVTIADNDVRQSNSPPSVRIVSPPGGAMFTAPASIAIFAEARDGDGFVTTVEFFDGTNSLGVATNNPFVLSPANSPINPFHILWTGVPPGSYSLSAKATDNEGAMSVSAAVHVTVNPTNSPPPVTNHPPVVNIVARDPIAVEGTNCWWLAAGWGPGLAWGTNHLCGPNTASFVVRRSDGTNSDLTVYYAVSGTASNGEDYAALTGSVTIPAGRRSAEILVTPLDDDIAEKIETVVLTLQLPPPGPVAANLPPPYAIGWPYHATAVILDNDQPRPPCQPLPDEQFHVCHPGTNGFGFRLDGSSDLVHWTSICTNIVTDGAIHFTDPDAAAFPIRFYRAVPEANPPED